MISLRQHAISIAAIFFALALGIVLGSQTIASDLLSGLRDDRANLQAIGRDGDSNYAEGLYQDPTSYQAEQGDVAFRAEAGYGNDQGPIVPFTGYSEEGIITADQVSPSLPPGSPTITSQPAGNDAGGSPYP